LYPLFPGTDEADQIKRIHRVLGTPDPSVLVKLKKHASTQANFAFPSLKGIGLAKLLPDAVANFLDLLTQSLAYEASTRITSRKAMKHSYFVGDSPFPTARFKVANDTKEMNSRTNHLTLSSKVESSKTSDLKQSETKPVTKTRSMVSILLARVR
jgi:serine/threonine protein kinase